MERPARPSHRRGGRDNPSFSSSLLDAIYRSIDESDGTAAKKHTAAEAAAEPPVIRKKHEAVSDIRYSHHRRRSPVLSNTTTSSSDSSSYGGFSSSDADSSRPRRIRTAPPPPLPDLPPPPPAYHGQDKKKPCSLSIRNRFRDLRKPKAGSALASPGARLASFINALFSSGAGRPKKAKISPPARVPSPSPCSSATSYTRSCLSKTPPSSGGGKRTVRFGPVSVVAGGEDGLRWRTGDGEDAARARESRRMVEELLRGLGAAVEEEEEDGGESDSSSDLFELEIGSARWGRYRDELPVYETTHFATNRAIAQGLAMH